jgi:hypothetical protein
MNRPQNAADSLLFRFDYEPLRSAVNFNVSFGSTPPSGSPTPFHPQSSILLVAASAGLCPFVVHFFSGGGVLVLDNSMEAELMQ